MNKLQTTNYKLQTDRGATAILLAFFVMNVLLMMALTAAGIMVYQIQMSRETANSITAFYAADAGAEQCGYEARSPDTGDCGTFGDWTIGPFPLDNGAIVSATRSATENKITSQGSFGSTRRVVQLTW